MVDLDQVWVDIPCPKCGYQDGIRLIDAKIEALIFCHNCKVSIQLVDHDASVHIGIDEMNNALKALRNTLKKFNK